MGRFFLLLLLSGALQGAPITSGAAELKVFVAEVLEPAVKHLFSDFERSAGHKLTVVYGTAVVQVKQLQGGEAVDVIVYPDTLVRNPSNAALFVPDTPTGVARAGQGVAVRAGAVKPALDLPDAMKQVLLQARAVAFFPQGASGQQTQRMFERLGIAEAMKAKVKATEPEKIADALVRGDADVALFLTHLLIGLPGIEYVGPYPGDLQQHIPFSAAVGAKASDPVAARSLVRYLGSPAATATITAHGLQPY